GLECHLRLFNFYPASLPLTYSASAPPSYDVPQTMLKTSPILTSCPSTPSGVAAFRHATARSSQDSPRLSAPMPRRASSRSTTPSSAQSMKSPVQTRLSRPSATNSPNHGREQSKAQSADVAQPDRQQASGLALQQDSGSARSEADADASLRSKIASPAPAPAIPSVPMPAEPELASRRDQLLDALSPGKRRGSPAAGMDQTVAVAETSSANQDPASAAKRPRPDNAPPKMLPSRYELCAVEDMVELIAYMLAELITTNDAIRMFNGTLTRFHSRTAPGISVRDYLHRLARHATLTPPLLLAMVYYIDRLCAMYQEFTINTLTVHRFLITAATVASKGLSDSFWNNTTYARVGGVRIAELNLLELEFLYRVDWRIVPNPEVLVAYYRGLVERTPGYELHSDESSTEDLSDESEEPGVDSDE
ncbi:hypothetical protein S40288_08680, partial [Stachybotrys chartarum IBT 40288]